MMMNWHPLINKAVDAVRTVAPELRHTPVYIVPASLLTGREEFSRAWGAIAHPSLDLVVRPHVHWLGRGFATIWSTKNIEEKGPDPLISLLETVVHELAHFFADHHFPFGDVDAPGGRPSKELIEYIHAGFENESSVVEEEERHAEKVLDSHGLRFIRALAHLKARLERRTGTIISLANLYGYPRPASMQQLCFYAGALAEEVEACQEMTFAEILERPAPSAFLEPFENGHSNPGAGSPGQKTKKESSTMPGIFDYLNSLKDSVAALVRDDKVTYRGLVISVASGKNVAPRELKAILREVGKTLEEFEAEVKLLVHRRELAANVKAFNRAAAEERTRRARQESRGKRFQTRRRRSPPSRADHERRRQPLHEEWLAIEKAELAARNAEAELRGRCSPDLATKDNELAERQSSWSARRSKALQDLFLIPNCDPQNFAEAEGEERKRIAKEYKECADQAKKDIEDADREIAELQRQRDEVAEKMLVVE